MMEEPEAFVRKIASAEAAMLSGDVMIFARIESLIAGLGLDDALARAETYLGGCARRRCHPLKTAARGRL